MEHTFTRRKHTPRSEEDSPANRSAVTPALYEGPVRSAQRTQMPSCSSHCQCPGPLESLQNTRGSGN